MISIRPGRRGVMSVCLKWPGRDARQPEEKSNSGALRHRLDDVAEDEKLAVLMKLIDDQPMGPRWVMAGFLLFLLLFFLIVMFSAGAILIWVQKWLS